MLFQKTEMENYSNSHCLRRVAAGVPAMSTIHKTCLTYDVSSNNCSPYSSHDERNSLQQGLRVMGPWMSKKKSTRYSHGVVI